MTTPNTQPTVTGWQAAKARLMASPMRLATVLCLAILGFVFLQGSIFTAVSAVSDGSLPSIVADAWEDYTTWAEDERYYDDDDFPEFDVGSQSGRYLLLGFLFGIFGIGCLFATVAITFAKPKHPRYNYGQPAPNPGISDPNAGQNPTG